MLYALCVFYIYTFKPNSLIKCNSSNAFLSNEFLIDSDDFCDTDFKIDQMNESTREARRSSSECFIDLARRHISML